MNSRAFIISDSLPFTCTDGNATNLYPFLIQRDKKVNISVCGSFGYSICGLTPQQNPNFAQYLDTSLSAWVNTLALIRGLGGAKIILMTLGTNDSKPAADCIAEIQKFKQTLDVLIEHIRPGSPMQLIIVSPINRMTGGLHIPALRSAEITWCHDNGVDFIDGSLLVPANANNFTDGVHLSVLGHSVMATSLTKAMVRLGKW